MMKFGRSLSFILRVEKKKKHKTLIETFIDELCCTNSVLTYYGNDSQEIHHASSYCTVPYGTNQALNNHREKLTPKTCALIWIGMVLQTVRSRVRIRINFRIRIQHFRMNTDPDPIRIQVLMIKKMKKIYS
jgi:hypothetical protein